MTRLPTDTWHFPTRRTASFEINFQSNHGSVKVTDVRKLIQFLELTASALEVSEEPEPNEGGQR